jgi:hypothetical protein
MESAAIGFSVCMGGGGGTKDRLQMEKLLKIENLHFWFEIYGRDKTIEKKMKICKTLYVNNSNR